MFKCSEWDERNVPAFRSSPHHGSHLSDPRDDGFERGCESRSGQSSESPAEWKDENRAGDDLSRWPVVFERRRRKGKNPEVLKGEEKKRARAGLGGRIALVRKR